MCICVCVCIVLMCVFSCRFYYVCVCVLVWVCVRRVWLLSNNCVCFDMCFGLNTHSCVFYRVGLF